MRRSLVLLLLLIACGVTTACGEDDFVPKPAEAKSAPSAASAATVPAPAVAGTDAAVIRDAAGAEVLSVRDWNGEVNISYTADGARHQLQGTLRDSGKRKYTLDGGAVMFEVKPNEKGFKLRSADGKLQWKVKAAADKIKVSDNEENKNPFELKINADGLKVVAPGDRLLGRVRTDAAKVVVVDAAGKESYLIEGPKSPAFGVLLLSDIPAPQRYILVAELLSGEQ